MQNFVATVSGSGAYDPSVTWSATGGSFTATGGSPTSYIAPGTAGNYTITVRSVQDPTKTASAVVNPINPYSVRLKRQEHIDANNALTSYWLYTYSSGNALTKVENYNGSNTLLSVQNYQVDLSGHRTRTDSYNASGVLSSYSTVEYNANYLPIRTTTFSAASVMTSRIESVFDPVARTMLSVDNYGSANTLSSRYVFSYDANNNRTLNTVSNSSGVVIGKTVYEYANGVLLRCTFYDANNVATGSRVFTFESVPTTEDLFAFGRW